MPVATKILHKGPIRFGKMFAGWKEDQSHRIDFDECWQGIAQNKETPMGIGTDGIVPSSPHGGENSEPINTD
jgi:hypothetical protein